MWPLVALVSTWGFKLTRLRRCEMKPFTDHLTLIWVPLPTHPVHFSHALMLAFVAKQSWKTCVNSEKYWVVVVVVVVVFIADNPACVCIIRSSVGRAGICHLSIFYLIISWVWTPLSHSPATTTPISIQGIQQKHFLRSRLYACAHVCLCVCIRTVL